MLKGINNKKRDPRICMVRHCWLRAEYWNRKAETPRGYCWAHRELALGKRAHAA